MLRRAERLTHITPFRSNRHGSDLTESTGSIECFDRMDVAALASVYNSPPTSHIAREDLLDAARAGLSKYELTEVDLEIAADSLARSMHMLLEQNGRDTLAPERMLALERDVLEWCGLSQSYNPKAAESVGQLLDDKTQ